MSITIEQRQAPKSLVLSCSFVLPVPFWNRRPLFFLSEKVRITILQDLIRESSNITIVQKNKR